MSKKLVKHEVDPARPTPLTAEQQAEITALHAMPDGEIDTSDIPPLTNEFWKSAVGNAFYKPSKTVNDSMVSKVPDADMQAAPKAILRAAQRAREIARQTNTPLVLVRDGVLVEEYVSDADTSDKETAAGA